MDATTQVAFYVAEALQFSAILSCFFLTVGTIAVALDLVVRVFGKIGASSGVLVGLRCAATLLLLSDLAIIGLLALAHVLHMLRQLV